MANDRTPDGRRFGILTYLDLLGFRDFLNTSTLSQVESRLQYVRHFQRSSSDRAAWRLPAERVFHSFQDSLIRFVDVGWTPDPANSLEESNRLKVATLVYGAFDEISSVRDILINFHCSGQLLRGAMITGPFELTENLVHGNAFLVALNIEQEVAKAPRVIVDPHLVKLLLLFPELAVWVRGNLAYDPEGWFYIDYLRGCALESASRLNFFLEYLQRHQTAVTQLLRSATPDHPAMGKLLWLREYHNTSVQHTTVRLKVE